jgi:hypothetical protein
MLRRTLAALAAVTVTACSAAPEMDIESSDESISTSFIADELLSDQELTDEGALDEEAIQRFLERTPYGTRSRLADLERGGKRAARMIVEASRRHHISPLAVLVRAQICASYVPVYAVAPGTLDYSTRGHTSWNGPRDTNWSVRIKLDQPFVVKGRRITHVYYTHLKSVAIHVPDGATHHPHVDAGQLLGVSGIANDVPHLHLGLIVDGRVGQRSDSDILKEWDVRLALGEYAAGERLPAR